MAAGETGIGRIFMHGRSQAVRLPKEFRLPGDRVRIRRETGGRLVLEPIAFDVAAWSAELTRLADPDFMAEGRNQPPMPTPSADELFD